MLSLLIDYIQVRITCWIRFIKKRCPIFQSRWRKQQSIINETQLNIIYIAHEVLILSSLFLTNLLDCIDGRYGDNCNETCSVFCKSRNCDGKTGTCTDGCLAGYTGSRCDQSESSVSSSSDYYKVTTFYYNVFVLLYIDLPC